VTAPEPARFTERTATYVRGNPLLRALLLLTFVDYAGSATLAFMGRLNWQMAGFLVLLSLMTWFFAVAVPILNRSVRENLGANPRSYWGGVVEKFARVVLCAQTGLYTALLIYVALGIL
jgi:hypothetical protein